jgi:hypothetical protein
MALNANESSQLATLTDDVSRMAGTVDDLLTLLRTADQGGAVDIATHNNAATAHGGVTGKVAAMRTPLTANTTFYLSATGNDANDGTTASTAKGSWNGIQALLNGIDPRGYVVTVQVSGKIAGNVTIALAGYASIKLLGTSAANDGFLGIVTFETNSVIGNLSFGKIRLSKSSYLHLENTIRITGLATADRGMEVYSDAIVFCSLPATIEYSGNFTLFMRCFNGGKISFVGSGDNQVSFVQVGNVTMQKFCELFYGEAFFYKCASEGDAVPSVATFDIVESGTIGGSARNLMPGGGKTVYTSVSANIGAKGVARAAGYVSSAGVLSNSFGITSVTKTATGVYQIAHNFSQPLALVTTFGTTAPSDAIVDGGGTTTTVRTFNASGVATDISFNIAIF